jgi:hypothetical protein
MKLNGHIIAYGILALVILLLLNMVLTSRKMKPSGADAAASGAQWTVYGTNGCGWTRKQLAVMDSKKIPYKFVDCDKEDCKGAEAFPTLHDPSGKKTVGFKEDF